MKILQSVVPLFPGHQYLEELRKRQGGELLMEVGKTSLVCVLHVITT